MISNADIKRVRSLRDKKYRDATGLFIVEGEKMVNEARESGLQIEHLWTIDEIGEAAMSKISLLTTPSPALAVVHMPSDEGLSGLSSGLNLALDSVRDPGNAGTIIRLAEWFGIETVYMSSDCVDVYNPKVIQSTMGSIFRIRIVRTDIADLCRQFKNEGIMTYGTFLDGEDIYRSELPSDALIVMGNESNGISAAVRNEVEGRLLIPSFGNSRSESLNVSVATAVTLSEFRRRFH